MNRRMLITAGPTHEPIDDVRYLANRSSGRMGIALAEAARDAGWDVTLLLGPVSVPPPGRVEMISFVTTRDLESLLEKHFGGCDVLIMAAAVADYRPRCATPGKLARTGGRMVLELESTPDLVAQCAARKRNDQRVIGFALEESAVQDHRAGEKLRSKMLDALVANPLATMGADLISACVLLPDGCRVIPPACSPNASNLKKSVFARWLIEWIGSELWSSKKHPKP